MNKGKDEFAERYYAIIVKMIKDDEIGIYDTEEDTIKETL